MQSSRRVSSQTSILGEPSSSNQEETSDARDRFESASAHDAGKFDLPCMVLEGCWLITLFTSEITQMGRVFESLFGVQDEYNVGRIRLVRLLRILVSLTFSLFVLRLWFRIIRKRKKKAHEGQIKKLSDRLGSLDIVSFVIICCMGGALGPGVLWVDTVIRVMLPYKLLFVLPFQSALHVVMPFCIAGYTSAAILGWTSLMSRPPVTADEIILLVITIVLNLYAKKVIDNSKFAAFLLLESKSKQALQEKVLRFQAEHEKEMLSSRIANPDSIEQSSYLNDSNAHESELKSSDTKLAAEKKSRKAQGFSNKQRSLSSAPAVLASIVENLQSAEVASDAYCNEDCLPPEASVWVQNDNLTRPVADVHPGEFVLCLDRLTGNLKYANVLDVQTSSGVTEWVKVTLTDGTTLECTADHCLQPVSSEEERGTSVANQKSPVRACDLQPQHDRIMVLKIVPVAVQNVQVHSSSSRPRVSLIVQHPERHAIFVKGPNGGTLQTMAVESANIDACNHVQFVHRRTFVEIRKKEMETLPKSAPPSLHGSPGVSASFIKDSIESKSFQSTGSYGSNGHSENMVPTIHAEDVHAVKVNSSDAADLTDTSLGITHGIQSSSENIAHAINTMPMGSLHNLADATVDTRRQGHACMTKTHHQDQSVESVHSTSSSCATVVVDPSLESVLSTFNIRGSDDEHPTGLDDLVHFQANGSHSVGSLLHASNTCKPCVFQNNYQWCGHRPCMKGDLCDFCHELHPSIVRQKRDRRREQRLVQKAVLVSL